MQDNPRFKDSAWVHVWVFLLLNATHKAHRMIFNGVDTELRPGQLITSRKSISDGTGVEQSKVERVLKTLKTEQQIEQVSSPVSRLITILNWELYQGGEQVSEHRVNSERTASEHRVNTNKNEKKDKNEEKGEGPRAENGCTLSAAISHFAEMRKLDPNATTPTKRFAKRGWTYRLRLMSTDIGPLERSALGTIERALSPEFLTTEHGRRTTKPMEKTATILTHAMQELQVIPRKAVEELPPRWPQCNTVNNPCETAWQRKWLNLDCWDPGIQAMATAAEAYAGRWFRSNPNPALLVLIGNTGVGKTHTAQCLFRFAQSAAFTAFDSGHWRKQFPNSGYYRWPEICKGFEEKEYSAVSDMFGLGLVVIDDAGAEYGTSTPWIKDNATDQLCQVLSRREHKFTILTSNIESGQWESRFDKRVADRLLRNSQVIDLTALKSYAMR
jgi:hypothetical protein